MTIQHLDRRLGPALAVVAGTALPSVAPSATPRARTPPWSAPSSLPAVRPAWRRTSSWRPAGDGYALHCSDERVAAVVIAACDTAALETRRNGTVVTARAGQRLAA